jgi:hypothetical protein
MMAAWNCAGWLATRMNGKRPDLPEILTEPDEPSGPKSPEAVWGEMLDWAARQRGVKIQIHEKPVI